VDHEDDKFLGISTPVRKTGLWRSFGAMKQCKIRFATGLFKNRSFNDPQHRCYSGEIRALSQIPNQNRTKRNRRNKHHRGQKKCVAKLCSSGRQNQPSSGSLIQGARTRTEKAPLEVLGTSPSRRTSRKKWNTWSESIRIHVWYKKGNRKIYYARTLSCKT